MMPKPVTEMALWELEGEFRELEHTLSTQQDSTPQEGESHEDYLARKVEANATMAAQVEALAAAFESKVEGWVKIYWIRRRRAEAAKAEATRLQALQGANQWAADRVRQTLHDVMKRLNLPPVDTGRFRVAVNQNGGNPSVRWNADMPVPLSLAKPVEVDPLQLWKVLEEAGAITEFSKLVEVSRLVPDSGKILAQAKATGEVPPGATVERGTHLKIS